MKKYFVIIPFALSIGCFVLYNSIGAYVAEDGRLVEPFFLIPIGWLFFFLALVLGFALNLLRD